MGNARYVGRVGALAVALGIGVAVANTPGIALADDTATTQSPAQGDTDPGAKKDTTAPPKKKKRKSSTSTVEKTADDLKHDDAAVVGVQPRRGSDVKPKTRVVPRKVHAATTRTVDANATYSLRESDASGTHRSLNQITASTPVAPSTTSVKVSPEPTVKASTIAQPNVVGLV
jgi:hypothetical protein